jgi:hypothetical protein
MHVEPKATTKAIIHQVKEQTPSQQTPHSAHNTHHATRKLTSSIAVTMQTSTTRVYTNQKKRTKEGPVQEHNVGATNKREGTVQEHNDGATNIRRDGARA